MVNHEDIDKAWTEFHIGEMVADYSCLRKRNVNERSSIDFFLQEYQFLLQKNDFLNKNLYLL